MLLSTLVTSLFLPLTLGFSFSLQNTTPAQCSQVSIEWTGGQTPFSLVVIPALDYPTSISIPDSSFDSSTVKGNYSWTVNYPKDTKFVIMMSDGSGTGTGGVSPLYQVASGSSSCNIRSELADFEFYLNATSLTQCAPLSIYWDNSAVTPVSILGAIPGGQVFQLVSVNDKTNSLVWNTNIAANTQLIMAALDSGEHGNGGSSALYTIGSSSDNSCINDQSPSSTTAGSPTATGTKSGSVGGVKTVTAITTQTSLPKGAAGLSTGALVGIIVSAVLVVIALQAALLWFCCRRQIRSLIYHRREMKSQEVKPGGEVDLALADHRSIDEYQDDNTDPYAALGARTSRYSMARSKDDVATTVSPYWDSTALPASSNARAPALDLDFGSNGTGQGSSSHERHDSFALSIGQSIPEHLTPSPSLSAGGDFGFAHSPSSPLVPNQYPSSSSASASGRGMTKAQMAASLSASNPDTTSQFGAGNRLPPQEAPSGGFRRHEDAGPLTRPSPPEEPQVEDLPPMYKPEWETDSQRGSER
ncbi:uncharacterized protein I206_107078 [Kwoniella pini CBS 10737]|uniref:Uncharacterized protein n=1 Tax=Kwoniella pini CBS 10737 TaxID=1296096 RepID=A0A1B9HZD6_9TREE|nr:uncharacterized protein I206_05378 [Kwoniella pini CBS 10737]OCF48598.1 hypothetical protein I206_05378 [Kwoniella pini CBS 10737]